MQNFTDASKPDAINPSDSLTRQHLSDFDETPFFAMWTEIAKSVSARHVGEEQDQVTEQVMRKLDGIPLGRIGIGYLDSCSHPEARLISQREHAFGTGSDAIVNLARNLRDYIAGAAMSMNPFPSQEVPSALSDYGDFTDDSLMVAADIVEAWDGLAALYPKPARYTPARNAAPLGEQTDAGGARSKR